MNANNGGASGKHAVFDDDSFEERDGETLPPEQPTVEQRHSVEGQKEHLFPMGDLAIKLTQLDPDDSNPDVQLLNCAIAKKFGNQTNKEASEQASNEAGENVIKLLESGKPKRLLKDSTKRTAAHYAAMTSDGEEALIKLVQFFGKGCLKRKDNCLATPLHYSMACFSKSALKKHILPHADRADLLRRTLTGDTVLHFAAINTNDSSSIFSADAENSHATTSAPKESYSCFCRAKKPLRSEDTERDKSSNETCSCFGSKKTRSEDTERDKSSDEACLCSGSKEAGSKETERDKSSDEACLCSGSKETRSEKTGDKTSETRIASTLISRLYEYLEKPPDFLQLKNSRGQTVLHLAAKYASPEELAGLILMVDQMSREKPHTCRASWRMQDNEGNCIYHYAVDNESCNREIVELMLFPNATKERLKQLKRVRHGEAKKLNASERAILSAAKKLKILASEKEPLLLPNKNNLTVLQSAICSKHCTDETTEYMIKIEMQRDNAGSFQRGIQQRDNFRNTALLYAVKHQKHKTALKLFCLTSREHWCAKNGDKQTALHLAFASPELMQMLWTHKVKRSSTKDEHQSTKDERQITKDERQSTKDERQGSTKDERQSTKDERRRSTKDERRRSTKDERRRSTKDERRRSTKDDHQSTKDDHQSTKDEHQSTKDEHQSTKDEHQSTKDKRKKFYFQERIAELCMEKNQDGAGRTLLFHACMGWNFAIVNELLDKGTPSTMGVLCTDNEKNSLLHALFYNESAQVDSALFSSTFMRLKNLGIEPALENELGQNCLHASRLSQDVFTDILANATGTQSLQSEERPERRPKTQKNSCFCFEESDCSEASDSSDDSEISDGAEGSGESESSDDEDKPNAQLVSSGSLGSKPDMIKSGIAKAFSELLVTSNGFHLVHSLVSKYELKKIIPMIAKLANQPKEALLTVTVSCGSLRGATCLHIACESSHAANIKYLVKQRSLRSQGLELVTHSGLSALDFTKTSSKMKTIKQVFRKRDKVNQLKLLRLIDPAHRGLKLPQREEAQQLLVTIIRRGAPSGQPSELPMKSGSKGKVVKETNIEVGHAREAKFGTNEYILYQALNRDSKMIYRCALRLGYINSKVEAHFLDFLCQKTFHDHCTLCSSDKAGVRVDKCRKRKYAWEKYISLSPMHSASEMLVVDIALHFERLELLPELIVTRQFELIPVCLSLLLQLRLTTAREHGMKQQRLLELKDKILNVAVNALDGLYSSAKTQKHEKLIVSYVSGTIKSSKNSETKRSSQIADNSHNPETEDGLKTTENATKSETENCLLGPRFPCRYREGRQEMYDTGKKVVKYYTVYKMAKLLDAKEIFATDCVHQIVKKKWNQPCHDYVSPKLKYGLHFAGFIAFLCFFAWFILDFNRTFQSAAPDVIMAAYLASFTLQEIFDILQGRQQRHFFRYRKAYRCPTYFEDQLNLFDCAAILFMWIGLLWKWAIYSSGIEHPTAYACQMVLSSSFLLWGFRSVSFLSYFERIGPVVSMMRSLLLKDLLPFAAILFVIFYSFSVFFFNLLFPVSTATATESESAGYASSVFLQVFTLPFVLFLDNPPSYTGASNGTDQAVGSVANSSGSVAFSNFFVYVFLIIVNIVMVNLLIALFSLRVSTMVSRARCIWRRKLFHMLQEFQSASPLPPPLSLAFYTYSFAQNIKYKVHPMPNKTWWKLQADSYPKKYIKFLKLQADYLNRERPNLLNQLEKNQPDFDGMKAFTRNSLTELHRQLEDTLEQQDEKMANVYLPAKLLEKVNDLEQKLKSLSGDQF